MLRLTPTTIALAPGELRGLKHRRRFKRLLRRMSNIQIHEDNIEELTEPINSADDALGLRNDESTSGPLGVPSPNNYRLNRHQRHPTPQDESDAGPSRLSSATHDATIITAVTSLSKAPHSRQRSQSNGSPQTVRQLNGMGPVLPPPFSARIRSMTSVDTESLHQLRAVPTPTRTPSTVESFDPLPEYTADLSQYSAGEETVPAISPTMPIYDDSMPPGLQPQTPQHLPESRHWSRVNEPQATASRSRAARGQSGSPAGSLQHALLRHRGPAADGFDGLYDGVENTDDEALYERSHGRRAIS